MLRFLRRVLVITRHAVAGCAPLLCGPLRPLRFNLCSLTPEGAALGLLGLGPWGVMGWGWVRRWWFDGGRLLFTTEDAEERRGGGQASVLLSSSLRFGLGSSCALRRYLARAQLKKMLEDHCAQRRGVRAAASGFLCVLCGSIPLCSVTAEGAGLGLLGLGPRGVMGCGWVRRWWFDGGRVDSLPQRTQRDAEERA